METAHDNETVAGSRDVTEMNQEGIASSETAVESRGGEEGTAAVAESRHAHDEATAGDKHDVDSETRGDIPPEKFSSHQMSGGQNQVETSGLPDSPAIFPEANIQQQSTEVTQPLPEPDLPPLPDTVQLTRTETLEAAAIAGAHQQDAAALPTSSTHDKTNNNDSSDKITAEAVQPDPAANSSHKKQGSHDTSSNVHVSQHSSTEQHSSHPPSQTGSAHSMTCPPHKETAVERLTTPTAMRMLKHLEQTQGGKHEWHIATGVPFKSKQLSADELSAMVDRLCSPKHETDNMPPKPHAVKLAYEGNKEVLVPVKESSKEENIAYMAHLYERCQETRAKTLQTLQDKWLQPLGRPLRHTSSAK